MNAKDIAPLFREIMKVFPDLAYNKRYLLKTPMGPLLRGIHFDPSAFSKDLFDVSTFMMPLCVPKSHLVLTFGARVLVPGQSWSLTMPDLLPRLVARIRDEALPFLDKTPTLDAFVQAARPYYDNPNAHQAAAYSLAKIGETRQAVETIEEYLPKLDMSSRWQKDLADSSRAFRHLLIYEPEVAAAKLVGWETETIRNLGLERFR